jgi:hypothetical protein
MSRPIITIYNCETNETIEREMNDSEFAQHQKDLETAQARQAEAEAQIAAKAALLYRLGITADEAKLLLS